MPHIVTRSRKQKAAEAEVQGFRQARGPFVVAAQTTRMAMVFTDAKSSNAPIIFANESFLSLTGYDRQEVLGQNFNFMMARRDDPEALAQVKSAFDGRSANEPEIRYRRKDSSLFWATTFVNPVKNEDGEVVEHFISLVDVSKQKQEEDRLRFLLDELDHRTGNTLATVQAIALQTLRGLADSEAVDAFEGRILALSKAHSLMGQDNWDAVSLRDVIDKILEAFNLNDCLSVEGDDIHLQSKVALTLAMVFHELATNAVKHGALSHGSSGHIHIGWQVEPTRHGDRMRLQWRESGGPSVTPPRRKGFGSRLIEGGLAQDVDGEVRLAYEATGIVCQIVMPISEQGGSRRSHD